MTASSCLTEGAAWLGAGSLSSQIDLMSQLPVIYKKAFLGCTIFSVNLIGFRLTMEFLWVCLWGCFQEALTDEVAGLNVGSTIPCWGARPKSEKELGSVMSSSLCPYHGHNVTSYPSLLSSPAWCHLRLWATRNPLPLSCLLGIVSRQHKE